MSWRKPSLIARDVLSAGSQYHIIHVGIRRFAEASVLLEYAGDCFSRLGGFICKLK
jgi:hypothetical protein